MTTSSTNKSRFNDLESISKRPLPIILLADVSGSMGADGKITALNDAIREMLQVLGSETGPVEFHLAVVTFGGVATLHQPLVPVGQVNWANATANGGTPMGAAIAMATKLIEDREKLPSKAYRPLFFLASDGQPTDDWTGPLKQLLGDPRGSKCQRLAMAIGADADSAMLAQFINDPETSVLQAKDARDIVRYFRMVSTMILSRSRSADPNLLPKLPPTLSKAYEA